jgi:hypothetical protein
VIGAFTGTPKASRCTPDFDAHPPVNTPTIAMATAACANR